LLRECSGTFCQGQAGADAAREEFPFGHNAASTCCAAIARWLCANPADDVANYTTLVTHEPFKKLSKKVNAETSAPLIAAFV
jgi:hypothetical protein